MLRPSARRSIARDEGGAAAVVSVLIAMVVLTLAALTVDLGNGLARKGDTQAQADFAALAGAPNLPGTKTNSDPAVLAAADYLVKNQPQDDRSAAWPSTTAGMAANLVDGSTANGEVYFPDDSRMQVLSPQAQVNFGFAGIFRMFGANVGNNVDVAADATVMTGTPDGLGVLPMYVASPTPGNPACDYGLQTLTDPPGGHVVPPVVPTLYLDTDTNENTLTGIDVRDGGAPASTIARYSTTGQITLFGDFKQATRVGFFRPDDPGLAPVVVQQSDPEWVSPATPYTQNNGQIIVNVPASVTSEDLLWYVRVYQAGTNNKWSARAEAQPMSVGDAPFECVGGSSSGNFGTLKMPRSTSDSSTANGWIARNIALGLEPPLSLDILDGSPPGSPPPWQCTSTTPNVVISTAALRKPKTNCLDTDTGMTSNTATPGFVMGNGTYKGLLDTGSSSSDPDGSGGCARNGTTGSVTVNGKSLNDDLLTCFMTDTTTEIGDVARRNYSGPVKFDPAIYKSPRFAWVPVFKQETMSGGSNKYSIVDFRAAFIADQPMTATKGNNAYNTGTTNGLGTTGSGGGFKVETLKVIFLNNDALPDGEANSPIGPNFGPDFPQVRRLID